MSDKDKAEAIARIEAVLREAGFLEFSGEAQLMDWSKSTAKNDPIVKFALVDDDAIEPFEGATIRKGKVAGQLYHILAIRLDEPSRPSATVIPMPAPAGPEDAAIYKRIADNYADSVGSALAQKLWRDGYFYNRKLWLALHDAGIYTLQQHKAYLESLPCAMQRSRKVKSDVQCAGDVVAHHADNASDEAAGRRRQPENPQKGLHFLALPLCHGHHSWVHSGGATREDKEALRLKAVDITAKQVEGKMKELLGLDSLIRITPELVNTFERIVYGDVDGEEEGDDR